MTNGKEDQMLGPVSDVGHFSDITRTCPTEKGFGHFGHHP